MDDTNRRSAQFAEGSMGMRPTVLLAMDGRLHQRLLAPDDVRRLERFAEVAYVTELEGAQGMRRFHANEDPEAARVVGAALDGADALIVCHGSPRITGDLMDMAPKLRLIGELEGDRFAHRIDLDAAWERGIRTVDTTNGSSYPVAEWALAMLIVSFRNGANYFRRTIEPAVFDRADRDTTTFPPGELYGSTVGLIGCGHIGRRLLSFLKPFQCSVRVHDPYLPKEMADALGFLQTSLDHVLSGSDAVVSLAPQTPATDGLIGRRELDLLRPGSVFVNVSRGTVVDSDALVERLRRGDICAGIDVFDPEPIPAGHPIKTLPNVFLTPHIASLQTRRKGRFFALMVDELERFFEGHETLFDLTPRSQANREGR